MLITHLIRNSPKQEEKKMFQTTHFEVKHQNGAHNINRLGIKTNSRPV